MALRTLVPLLQLLLVVLLCVSLSARQAADPAATGQATTYDHLDNHVLKCLFNTNIKDMTWTADRMSVHTTRTVHPFLMALLPPDRDKWISMKLKEHGIWDPQVGGPMQFIIQEKPCAANPRRSQPGDSIVIDVGANIGYFAAFALSLGCSTAIFEPQVFLGNAIEATLCLNQQSYKKRGVKAQLVRLPVSSQSRVSFPPKNELHNGNPGGVGAADCRDKGAKCTEYQTVQLDAFMYGEEGAVHGGEVVRTVPGKNIRVMKIDAEGFENDVLMTMKQILAKKDVDNILFEMIPHVNGLLANHKMLRDLVDAGYYLAECPFSFLEGVRKVEAPFIKQVVPMNISQAEHLITTMHGVTEKQRQNWKIKHYTDMWASVDPDIFQRYNKVTYAA